MRRALLAVLVLVTVLGCGPHHRRAHAPSVNLTGWPTGELVQVGVCDVTLPAGLDPVRRDRILDAVATITSAWASDEGVLPETSIGVTDEEPGCCVSGVYVGGNYGGCWRGDRWIILNADQDTCAYLYHELAHRTYSLYGHADPRWPRWNARMQALWLQLIGRPK